MNRGTLEFELIWRGQDGSLGGAYIKLQSGRVHHTEEIRPGVLLADYDKNGRLLGIDILAAVNVSIVTGLVDDPRQRASLKKVMKNRLGDLFNAA